MSNKSEFNENNRTTNSIKTSFWGVFKSVLDILLGFAYRTVFIRTLGADYLGLNGLFTNVLQVLSLAELGVTTAIVFRFYKPISNKDYVQVGKLMNYLKKVYRCIAIFILVAGLLITPFITFFINDTSTIPPDINVYFIYLLFLLNTVSSYLFVYKQNILSADQRGYISAIFGIITTVIRYSIQVIILFVFKDYSATLIAGVAITIFFNFFFSLCAQKMYKAVFSIKDELEKEQRTQIINDTKAVMFHKVGATVKLSTDSIILSKFVNLASTGIYSNYSLIISGLQALIGQLLGNFVSSVGNAHVKLAKEDHYKIYKKLLFIDLWISTVTIVCSYLLLNDFIFLWAGPKYLFDKITLIMLCLQFYIFISRQINISYTNGCGLFTRDRIRPIIEAALNLGLSIVGVQLWGIVGVFIGTVVSSVVTVVWREPLILFREEFKQPVIEYWKTYFSFVFFSLALCIIGDLIKTRFITVNSWLVLIVEAIVIFSVVNILLFLMYHKSEEYTYMKQLIVKILKKKLRKF